MTLREGEKMPEFLEGRVIMPIRKFNPTSPGTRFQTVQTFDEITTHGAAQAAGRAAAPAPAAATTAAS